MPPGAPVPANELSPELMQTAAKNDRKRTIVNSIRGFVSFAIFVATVVIAALLINQFIFQSYYVDGTSMTPTLQNNDRLIIDKTGKTIAGIEGKAYVPNRGDVVILGSSIMDQYGHDEQLIKRVIGLPGETIDIQDGIVTIKNAAHPNGFNADQELGLHLAATYSDGSLEVKIPDNSVFVMGDNRIQNGSFDSRAFGSVPTTKVQGRLALRIFPFNQIRTF